MTKPLVARAAQVAVEEGAVELDTEAGPPGSTVRHLLAHASGYSMHSADLMAEPGKRRVYSNYGFGSARGGTIQQASGIEFGRYLTEAVCEPLGMSDTTLSGGAEAAGFGATSTVADLVAFAGDLLRPSTVSAQMHSEATNSAVPGPVGGAARIRDAATQRLGPGLRDQERQVAALDGSANSGAHLRAFRPVRDVFVGGSARLIWRSWRSRTAISATGRIRAGRRSLTES